MTTYKNVFSGELVNNVEKFKNNSGQWMVKYCRLNEVVIQYLPGKQIERLREFIKPEYVFNSTYTIHSHIGL